MGIKGIEFGYRFLGVLTIGGRIGFSSSETPWSATCRGCGLLREQVMDDPVGLRQPLRKLLKLDFDTLLVGDGVSIPHPRGEGKA